MIEKKFTLNRSASSKRKLIYISIGLVIGLCSLMFTNYIVRELAQKEHNEIQLWSHAMAMAGGDKNLNPAEQNRLNELIGEIIDNNTSIPSIVTDEYYRVLKYSNIPQKVIDNPKLLRKELEDMASSNDPIEVNIFNYNRIYIF